MIFFKTTVLFYFQSGLCQYSLSNLIFRRRKDSFSKYSWYRAKNIVNIKLVIATHLHMHKEQNLNDRTEKQRARYWKKITKLFNLQVFFKIVSFLILIMFILHFSFFLFFSTLLSAWFECIADIFQPFLAILLSFSWLYILSCLKHAACHFEIISRYIWKLEYVEFHFKRGNLETMLENKTKTFSG